MVELSGKIRKYRDKVQKTIEYCSYCQPYDEGDYVWIYGDRTDIEDVFDICEVPEEMREEILLHLVCPFCGNTCFDLASEVGLKTKFEKEVDSHVDEAYGKYGNEVRALEELLEQSPLLALENELAIEIYKEIKRHSLPTTSINGKFFRARKVESSEVKSSTDMQNPPLGKSLEGRFNHAGQSHLYLARNKETALEEVAAKNDAILAWLQEFELENEVDNILNLSFDWSQLTPSTSLLLIALHLGNSITRSDRNVEYWQPDYCLTRFIMDCAKKSGYNGIKYNSAKSYSSENIVLFYPENIKIKAIGEPKVEIFRNKLKEKFHEGDLF